MGKIMTAMERAGKLVTDWLWESRDMAPGDGLAHLEVVAAREIRAVEQGARPGGHGPARRHSGERLRQRSCCPRSAGWTKAALVRRLHDKRVEIEKEMNGPSVAQASMLIDVCRALDLADDDVRYVVGDVAFEYLVESRVQPVEPQVQAVVDYRV